MITVAQKPRIMTDEEVLDMAVKLEDLRERGWTMTQIADELGYSNPSTLYTAKRELRGIEFDRYRKLRRVHAGNIEPPETGRPRDDRKPSIPEARVDRFLGVVNELQQKGVTQEVQARAAGYGSSAGTGWPSRPGESPSRCTTVSWSWPSRRESPALPRSSSTRCRTGTAGRTGVPWTTSGRSHPESTAVHG